MPLDGFAPSPFAIHRPLNVAVLHGGPSAEREISLDSGRDVAAALARRGHDVTLLDPGAGPFQSDSFLRLADWQRFDAAFLALHGTIGEDGTVQRLLNRIGLPFTGSDADASRLAFSKSAAKERFAAEAVPTPAYVLVHEHDPPGRMTRHAETMGFPLVVKPDAQGSSLGVSLVQTPSELPAALELCFALGRYGLLERYVAGQEWTVAFLGDQPLPPMRVSTPRSFLDFEAKYRDDATSMSFDTGEPPDVVAAIVDAASQARKALRCTGVSRVDVRLDSRNAPWVLEVNTLPGFTSHSAVPTAAAHAGIGFDDLCERVVALALPAAACHRAA